MWIEADGKERPYEHWAKYRSEWWTRYFTGALLHFWPPQLDQTEIDASDYRWVSRNDVFGIASVESDHRELHTAVAAYVWGLGKNAFSIGRLVRAFTTNIATVEDNLRAAASVLDTQGSVAAYESLLRGPYRTKFMGPAYFTKYLFFVGYRQNEMTDYRPLILDSRVATALRRRGVFAPKVSNSGWPGTLYERYLSYCHEQNPSNPESIEVELFNEGRVD